MTATLHRLPPARPQPPEPELIDAWAIAVATANLFVLASGLLLLRATLLSLSLGGKR